MALLGKRRPPTPADDAARAELRRLVTEHREFIDRCERLTAARSSAYEATSEARRQVESATAAVETAKTDATRHRVASAIGELSIVPKTVREARAALQDAEDELESTIAAREQIEADLKATGGRASSWSYRLEEAAAAVLRQAPAIPGLIEELEQAQRRVADLGGALRYLVRVGAVATTGDAGSPVRCLDQNLERQPIAWEVLRDVPGAAPWSAAFDRLMSDPDAPLP